MKVHPILRTICITACAWAALTATAQADGSTYAVQAGDTLSSLAIQFGVTVEQLQQLNGLQSDRIYAEQQLVVAPSQTGETQPTDAQPADAPSGNAQSPEPEEAGTAAQGAANETAPGQESAEPAAAAPTAAEDAAGVGEYIVERGDTLSFIAVQLRVREADLRVWNPDINPNRIVEGQRLRVGMERHRRVYRARRGDSLSLIARRFGTTTAHVLNWNPDVRADRVRIGEEIILFTAEPESPSESVGAPTDGALENAVRLRPHPGYVIRDRQRAWATNETAEWVVGAFEAVRSHFPGASRVRVHDISRRRGGPLHGHRSHQSGRDVDISYYQQQCRGRPCPMRRVDPDALDVGRQWALFEHWLVNDQVEAIFVDYRLQEALYRYARAQGASRQNLHRWFQYPHGRDYPLGVIRHFPNHRDHFHVRFQCAESDDQCQPIR